MAKRFIELALTEGVTRYIADARLCVFIEEAQPMLHCMFTVTTF